MIQGGSVIYLATTRLYETWIRVVPIVMRAMSSDFIIIYTDYITNYLSEFLYYE